MLCGLVEPSLFVRMSRIPAHSSTARTGPPAITPVPDAAGLSSTRPAPCFPTISCGIVPPVSGTSLMLRRAASTALRTASLTSFALPVAIPTCPLPSPTATNALKEKRRPPFTTFATRLIATTFSTMPSPSRPRSPPSRLSPPRPLPRPPRPPPPPPPPPRGPRGGRCSSTAAAGAAADREATLVIYELRVDVLGRTKHDEPRPLRRALDLLADAQVAAIALIRRRFDFPDGSHGLFRRLGCLARLAADLLARVTDAFALVGLGRPYVAQLRGHLTHEFLVDALDLHEDVVGHRDLDALGRVIRHGMRESDHQLHAERLRLGLVADALDLERLRESRRHALDHFGDERAREAVQRLVLRLVGGALHHDRGVLEGDVHVLVERAADFAFRPLDRDLVPVDLRGDALGQRHGLPADT